MSYIGKNPSWNSGGYTPLSSDPGNPTEGDTFYSDGTPRAEGLWVYKNGSWQQVGTTSSTFGINYILDPDSEGPLVSGQWNTYADSAGTKPVDGTGGAPTSTFTRETASPLRGGGSFKLSKDAANRQGEGVSTDFTIDEHDKRKILAVSFDYEATANFEAADVSMWIYDVDNTQLLAINPDSDLIPGSNTFQGTFLSTDADDYRLIMHISSTDATAWDVLFDNVKAGPQLPVFGPAMTDWSEAETHTWSSTGTSPTTGTIARDTLKWRRVGSDMVIHGEWKQTTGGSDGSGTFLLEVPSGYSIDTSKLDFSSDTGQNRVGFSIQENSAADRRTGAVQVHDATHLKFFVTTSNEPWNPNFGGFAAANRISFQCSVPIVGWDTNIVTSEDRVFNISNVITNGTRVTTTPTALGEYRSRSKTTASSNTFADAAPTTSTTTANGMRLDPASYGTGQTSGLISMWDIYVGLNKTVHPVFYDSTGKTGKVFVDFDNLSSTLARGSRWHYDESTGVVTVEAGLNISTNTTRGIGTDETGANVSGGYFDIVVSDNAFSVQTEVTRDRVILDTGNGHGSTNTKIRNYTTITSTGASLTAANDATNGSSVTVDKSGNYSITVMDSRSGGTHNSGISINSAQLTTNVESITLADRIALDSGDASAARSSATVTYFLEVGDVIRHHTDGNADGTTTTKLIVQRVN